MHVTPKYETHKKKDALGFQTLGHSSAPRGQTEGVSPARMVGSGWGYPVLTEFSGMPDIC